MDNCLFVYGGISRLLEKHWGRQDWVSYHIRMQPSIELLTRVYKDSHITVSLSYLFAWWSLMIGFLRRVRNRGVERMESVWEPQYTLRILLEGSSQVGGGCECSQMSKVMNLFSLDTCCLTAKSDFPCPEFNGELSFRVVSTYWFEIYLLETRYFKKRELFMRQ